MWTTVSTALGKLFENIAALLIVCGAALIIVGAAGGVTYNSLLPIPDLAGRATVCAAGLMLVLLGIFPRSKGLEVNPHKFGFVMDEPRADETRPVSFIAKGRYKTEPPDGVEFRIFRMYPGTTRYYPLDELVLKKREKKWEAKCYLAGNPGDKRVVALFMVGPSGRKLIRYFREATDVHNKVRETSDDKRWLPDLLEMTDDMVECQRVEVTRT